MNYAITIEDTVDEMTIDLPSPPMRDQDLDFEALVTVMSGDVYLDHFASKKQVTARIQHMSDTDFDRLRDFARRQRTLWQFPIVSIPDLGINNMVVMFSLTPKDVIDKCGTVEDVEMIFRETVQMTSWSSS